MTVAIDPRRADSRRAVADVMAGPLAAGFSIDQMALTNGVTMLPQEADDVTVLARLRQDLGSQRLAVVAQYGDGADTKSVTLDFDSYSSAGTSLLVRRRGPVGDAALPIKFSATLDGQAVADPGEWLCIDALAGNVGHFALLLTFEHQRLRRHLGAAAAARTLAGCRGALLDRVGAELGVPRLESRLEFAGGVLSGITPARETDERYRTRLATYRARIFPTAPALRSRLREIHPALGIEERKIGFEGAFRLVAVDENMAAATLRRSAAFAALRRDVFIDPGASTAIPAGADPALRARRLLAAAIRDSYGVPAGQSLPLAPALARALDRLAGFLKAVGYQAVPQIEQAQADDGGARYELGLGARLAVSGTFVADLSAKVAAADPAQAGPFAKALLRLQGMSESERGQIGALLGPSGLTTALVLDATHVYVSHMPGGTMDIEGPGVVVLDPAGHARADFTAREIDPVDVSALAQALQRAATMAGVKGDPVDGASLIAAFGGLPAHRQSYLSRILPPRLSIEDQPGLGNTLQSASPDHLAGMKLKPAQSAKIVAGDEGTWDSVLELAFGLADEGIPALALAVTAQDEVLLAASTAPLPGLGANLTLQRTFARAWAKADLSSGAGGYFGLDRGETYVIEADRPGLWCVALSSYRRMDQPDPAEIRPTLPDGIEIDYETYERMMNLLQLARPLGVAVNTWRIRQRHVRLDGAAPLAALNLSAARSYRRFQQARFAHPLGSSSQGDGHG